MLTCSNVTWLASFSRPSCCAINDPVFTAIAISTSLRCTLERADRPPNCTRLVACCSAAS